MSSTKQAILDTALDLFSIHGYEATSTGQIADAVGIRKSSLYNHFESKQAILDTLIDELDAEFDRGSVFSISDEALRAFADDFSVESYAALVKKQVTFLLHNDNMRKVRRLLTIEQFRDPKICAVQTRHVYTEVLAFNRRVLTPLIEKNVITDGDIDAMAAQFAFPISAWIALCDREPEREAEVMDLIERHVRQFVRVCGKR